MTETSYFAIKDDVFNGIVTPEDINMYGDIYYWHEYLPCRIRRCSDYDRQVRDCILDFKGRYVYDRYGRKSYSIKHCLLFSCELLNAVRNIADEKGYTKVALVAVPKSKCDKPSGLCYIIESYPNTYMESLKDRESHDALFHGIKPYDYSRLLERISDLPEKHNGGHITDDMIYDSLKCTKDLHDDDKAFFIIDDIVTSGQTLDVCKRILIDNGAKPERIVKMAIAKTTYKKYNG